MLEVWLDVFLHPFASQSRLAILFPLCGSSFPKLEIDSLFSRECIQNDSLLLLPFRINPVFNCELNVHFSCHLFGLSGCRELCSFRVSALLIFLVPFSFHLAAASS